MWSPITREPRAITAAPGWVRRSRSSLIVVVVVAGTLALASAAGAATPRWHHCTSYSVVQHDRGSTYTTYLYRLRVQGASCQTMRRVLHRYFFGKTRPAGPLPSYGVWADHWRVLLRMGTVYGTRGRQHFAGLYSVT